MRTEPNNKRKQQMQAPNASNKCKQQMQATNASNKCKQQTQATNASTNGGDASRVGKRCCYYFVACVFSPPFSIPTRDASPPLEFEFCA